MLSFSFPNPMFPMNDLPYFEWNKKQPSHTEQISCPPNDSIWALPKNPSTTLGFLGSGGHTNSLTPMTAERLKCAQHAQPWISSIIQWASKIAIRYIHYLPSKVNYKWKQSNTYHIELFSYAIDFKMYTLYFLEAKRMIELKPWNLIFKAYFWPPPKGKY